MYRGRAQLGDTIYLGVQCLDGSGTPTAPTAAPTMKIYDSSDTLVLSKSIPPVNPDRATGLFGVKVFLGSSFAAGDYGVRYTWVIGATTYVMHDRFTVLPGGDAKGHVEAQYWHDMPHADYLIHLTSDGTLRKGRNPSI